LGLPRRGEVLESSYKGGYPSPPLRTGSSAPLNPDKIKNECAAASFTPELLHAGSL